MITLISWGHKFGNPPANFKFDVSYLKNPWREKKLQNASEKRILKFMENQKEFKILVNSLVDLVSTYEKLWPKENLIFAVCCSAGSYRSPMVVKSMEKKLKKTKINCKVKHPFYER